MKTAVELLAIKHTAEMEYEEKHLETKAEYLRMMENAQKLCDTFINKEMIRKAEHRERLIMTFKIYMVTDCLNNSFFYLVKEDVRHRKHNQYFTYDYSIGYAYNTFVEYLNLNGFDVEKFPSIYKSYDMGDHYCHELLIKARTIENLES